MDYIFYDTETTGLNPYFDQILQFAAIRTDANLKETDRFEIRCQIQPHILANPIAMQVTGISASALNNPNLPSHYDMMTIIRKTLLSWSPAIFLGHNSLKFDEAMLRSGFYQTLLPPYLTNTHQNKRMDSLPIFQATSLIAPDVLTFPENENGDKSFKLDRVAPANGFDHSQAHEAVSDVEATLYLCRLIKQGAPDIWNNFVDNADKFKVLGQTKRARAYGVIQTYFGKTSLVPVATLGVDSNNSNAVFALNLTYDPHVIAGMNDEEIRTLFESTPRPILTLRANAMPSLWDLSKHADLTASLSLSPDDLKGRAEALATIAGLKTRILDLYQSLQTGFEESIYVERQIYSGFPSKRDTHIMEAFHTLDWKDRWAVAQSLTDPRYKKLGERLVFLNAPEAVPENIRTVLQERMKDRLLSTDPHCEWLTLDKAIKDTQSRLRECDDCEKTLLEGHLENYKKLRDAFLNDSAADPTPV